MKGIDIEEGSNNNNNNNNNNKEEDDKEEGDKSIKRSKNQVSPPPSSATAPVAPAAASTSGMMLWSSAVDPTHQGRLPMSGFSPLSINSKTELLLFIKWLQVRYNVLDLLTDLDSSQGGGGGGGSASSSGAVAAEWLGQGNSISDHNAPARLEIDDRTRQTMMQKIMNHLRIGR